MSWWFIGTLLGVGAYLVGRAHESWRFTARYEWRDGAWRRKEP